jgi:hypothetical protein
MIGFVNQRWLIGSAAFQPTDRVEQPCDAGRKPDFAQPPFMKPVNSSFPARSIEELTWLIQPERSKNRK